MKFAFKKTNHNNTSLVASPWQGGIVYKLFRKCKPKKRNGPLAVFKSLNDARSFWPKDINKIYLCLIKESNCKFLFYYSSNGNLEETEISFLPHGTIIADWVMPILKIRKRPY